MRDILEAHRTDPAIASEYARHANGYYGAYRDGHLLEAGGWGDQPARYGEWMTELRALEAQVDEKYWQQTHPKEDDA